MKHCYPLETFNLNVKIHGFFFYVFGYQFTICFVFTICFIKTMSNKLQTISAEYDRWLYRRRLSRLCAYFVIKVSLIIFLIENI